MKILMLLNLIAFIHYTSAAKMLLVMTMGTKSHKHFYSGIADALAEKGHQFTLISPYKETSNKMNIREILITRNYADESLQNTFNLTFIEIAKKFFTQLPVACISTMIENDVQNALKEDYDLIFLPFSFSSCYLSIVYEKKIPLIHVFPNKISGHPHDAMGNIEYLSISPIRVMEVGQPMTFVQRMLNTLLTWVLSVLESNILMPLMEAEGRRQGLYPTEMPSLAKIEKESSLALINAVRTLETPIPPYVENIKSVGGIHIKPPKPLPKELTDWLKEGGNEGFIFFSLGSQAKPSDMKEEHKEMFINIFRTLKIKVLWKWDEDHIEELSSNVKIAKWFPQNDVLGHPKIRLFITHCGLLSLQEATYYGVPVLAMPVFSDQFHNANNVRNNGWGVRLDWNTLNEDKIKEAILQVLNNQSIKQQAQYRSKLMKDRPISTSEEVVYWVEYVLRYNGAKHLSSTFNKMPWYQIYNVDVWLSIYSILFIVLLLIFYIIKFSFKCFTRLLKKEKNRLIWSRFRRDYIKIIQK